MPEVAPLYPASRLHLQEMTSEVAIWQHARGIGPDPRHGYSSDDVARALGLDLLHGRELGWDAVSVSAWHGLRFLEAAFAPDPGRFRNFRDETGRWLERYGSEDVHARVLLALAQTMTSAPDGRLRAHARSTFGAALPAAGRLTALRPRATVLLACDVALRFDHDLAVRRTRWLVARQLMSQLPASVPPDGWRWPESTLTYESALVPQALITAGTGLGNPSMVDRGLDLLDWLLEHQLRDGHFSPIGNRGWWRRGQAPARYDQQPIEATSLLLASEAALLATGDRRHALTMEMAYAWFLGANDASAVVADPLRGGCRDGLGRDGPSLNQGAESTLMWLTALERIRRLRRASQPRAAAATYDAVASATAAP